MNRRGRKVRTRMMARFPLGSRVGFRFSIGMGDFEWGWGTVQEHAWDSACVKLDLAPAAGYRNVSYSNLVTEERARAEDAAYRLRGGGWPRLDDRYP